MHDSQANVYKAHLGDQVAGGKTVDIKEGDSVSKLQLKTGDGVFGGNALDESDVSTAVARLRLHHGSLSSDRMRPDGRRAPPR